MARARRVPFKREWRPGTESEQQQRELHQLPESYEEPKAFDHIHSLIMGGYGHEHRGLKHVHVNEHIVD